MSENIDDLGDYEKRILSAYYGLCPDCNQPKTDKSWCRNCNSKRFQQDFDKWTSGNKHIDKFIQDAQLKARCFEEFIEWIPYNRLRNIQFLAQGGFSTIYEAILLDGYIFCWDYKVKKWKRTFISLSNEDYKNAKKQTVISPLDENEKNGKHVVLKCLESSSNLDEEFLNEVNYFYYNDLKPVVIL